jgi:tetratricopeptide (TPR) repeat protein
VKHVTIIFFVSLLTFATRLSAQQDEVRLQQILSDLYQTFGNYQFEKPSILLSDSEEMGAGYFQATNTIRVEKKLLEVCRSLGNDSTAALYFVLGHELTHFYQEALTKQRLTTNFLAYTEQVEATYRLEKDADLQGAFLSYLCGQNIRSGLPRLIEALYRSYALNDRLLTGYPPKRQRLHTADQTLELQDRMVMIYDNSVALMVLGEYDFAREGFQSLQEYYHGYEVRYNIGLCALLEAIYFPAKNVDPYFFPIEISEVSRIHKPGAIEGEKDLDLAEMWQREILLNMARTSFIEVQRINPTYIPSYLGFTIVLTLQRDFDGARKVLEKTMSIPGGKAYRYELMLLEAIINAMNGQVELAEEIFREITRNGPSKLQRLAALNLERLRAMPSRSSMKPSDDRNQTSRMKPESNPILLTNGTHLYQESDGASSYFTYIGNKRSLVLERHRVDKSSKSPGPGAVLFQGSHYDFYFFPETGSYWKVTGEKVVEEGTLQSGND